MLGVLRSGLSVLDSAVFQWILAHRSSLLNPLMVILSHGGGLAWSVASVVLGLVFRGRWPAVYQSVLAIGLAVLLADAVAKPLVARHRPFIAYTDIEVMAKRQRSASFPSTHAASAFAGAVALSGVFPEGRAAFWMLAALVAFSRVYVGVHYPLDVLAGAAIGLAAALFILGGTRWRHTPIRDFVRDAP